MKRILIIEDELEMLRNLTTILRLEKFRPLSAENGRVGVDLAKKHKPDLILWILVQFPWEINRPSEGVQLFKCTRK